MFWRGWMFIYVSHREMAAHTDTILVQQIPTIANNRQLYFPLPYLYKLLYIPYTCVCLFVWCITYYVSIKICMGILRIIIIIIIIIHCKIQHCTGGAILAYLTSPGCWPVSVTREDFLSYTYIYAYIYENIYICIYIYTYIHIWERCMCISIM